MVYENIVNLVCFCYNKYVKLNSIILGRYVMTLTQIRMFLATVEHGNFTRAAEQLYITPPGLLKQINSMEKELGFPLFIRSKRSVELSPYGEKLMKCYQHFIDQYDDLLELISEQLTRDKNTIYLGRPEQLSPDVVDFAINTFLQEHPDLSIIQQSYKMHDLYNHLNNGQLDLILGFEDAIDDQKNLEYRILLRTEYQALFPEKDISGQPVSFDLSNYEGKIIAIKHSHHMLNGNLMLNMKDFFASHETVYVSNLESVFYNTSNHMGVSFVDEYANINPFYHLNRYNLGIHHYLILAYRKADTNPNIRALSEYIFNYCRQLDKCNYHSKNSMFLNDK